MKGILSFFLAFLSLLPLSLAAPSSADSGRSAESPLRYALNRADEDYSFLRDAARRTYIWDRLKYIPFNDSGS